MKGRDCIARTNGDGWELLSPGVGLHVLAPPENQAVAPGDSLGRLEILGKSLALQVPEGVQGILQDPPSARRRRPVAWGSLLARVSPGKGNHAQQAKPTSSDASDLLVLAPQAGRFWRRAAPDRPLYAPENSILENGKTLGLLEVMKTFQPVRYMAGGALPQEARVLRFLVEDGQEIAEGQAILEIRPAHEA